MNELALFAGAGGGLLASRLLGWRTVCAVEIDKYCQRVLLQRQRDECLERFPIWDDVCTFDGSPWRGSVDIVTGGFPCQDISTAGGPNRLGLNGSKSGLWGEMFRIICEVGPRFLLMENSPALTFRGLNRVLSDLASIRLHARWGVFSAADIGARHERERIWIVGLHRDADSDSTLPQRGIRQPSIESIRAMSTWLSAESQMVRKSDGMANRMDRLRAIGNGQVPSVVVRAWNELSGICK
jgi:DNA (cytosine-5)-methyltransferase 1